MTDLIFREVYWQFLTYQRGRSLARLGISSYPENISGVVSKIITRDMDSIIPALPKDPKFILDIGCGLGLVDLGIFHHYGSKIAFTLIDKSMEPKLGTQYSGFHDEYVFYNSLEYTEEFLTSNGIENLTIFEADSEELSKVRKQDLILSLLSCGWHYPVTAYLDYIVDKSNSNTVVILDIRSGTDGLDRMSTHFSNIVQLHSGSDVRKRYAFSGLMND